MKKLFIIPIIICSLIFVMGCAQNTPNTPNNQNKNITENNQNDNSAPEDKSNNQDTDKTETSNSPNNITDQKTNDTNSNKTNKKEYYLKKLDNIQTKIDTDYNDKEQLTTYDMRRANDAKYKLWDDVSNEIYKDLQNTLSASDKENLTQEELVWIAKKESDAENTKKKVEGGTLEPVFYSQSLVDSTKNRCYELVNKYIN